MTVAPWQPPQAWPCLCPQSCLEFSLRIQEFIELIRQNKRLDAVRYVERGQALRARGAECGVAAGLPWPAGPCL